MNQIDITTIVLVSIAVAIIVGAITFFIKGYIDARHIGKYYSVVSALKEKESELKSANTEFERVDGETKGLQGLKAHEDSMKKSIEDKTQQADILSGKIDVDNKRLADTKTDLADVLKKIGLYSDINELVDCGHFEFPQYMHGTSEIYQEKLKEIRQKQKDIIRAKNAVNYSELTFNDSAAQGKRMSDGFAKILLTSFNIECDLLFGRIRPSNYGSTMERIVKIAEGLEKSAKLVNFKISQEYISLKKKECTLVYEHSLKKQEEQEEQREIKNRMREEAKATKEFEKAVSNAEKEEKLREEALSLARKEYENATDEIRADALKKIEDLEAKLLEAQTEKERAKSMAEQTKQGHVYVISNIGSFGENVYKIGMTRRLDPMERVKELGDASVPFSFDVHAMIFSNDAPNLERALHTKFHDKRVNAINTRKEFFNIDLDSVKVATHEIAGDNAEFTMTALAEQYRESQRLLSLNS